MSAKHKLNSAHFNGSLVIAGIAGLVTESFMVFVIALAALLATSLHSERIRP